LADLFHLLLKTQIWNQFKFRPAVCTYIKLIPLSLQNRGSVLMKTFFRAGCNPRPAVKVRESRLSRDRPGETPGPTVKVWMEEEFLMRYTAFAGIVMDL